MTAIFRKLPSRRTSSATRSFATPTPRPGKITIFSAISGSPFRGGGIFVLNPRRNRLLSLQSPHPAIDSDSGQQSVWLYFATGATFLQIAGTNRCNSTQLSPCSGTTTVCNSCLNRAGNPKYPRSDVAHNHLTLFQVASDLVSTTHPSLVSISVHGFSPDAPVTSTSIAQIGNGTVAPRAGSLATTLAVAYNDLLRGLNFSGQLAASLNRTTSDPAATLLAGDRLSGNTNTQGRSLNNSPDPCLQDAPVPLPQERFLHIEQQRGLRRQIAVDGDPNFPGNNWTIARDAFNRVFRRCLWIDPAFTGTQLGTFTNPYRTLASAHAAASGGELIKVKGGILNESFRTSKRLRATGADTP